MVQFLTRSNGPLQLVVEEVTSGFFERRALPPGGTVLKASYVDKIQGLNTCYEGLVTSYPVRPISRSWSCTGLRPGLLMHVCTPPGHRLVPLYFLHSNRQPASQP